MAFSSHPLLVSFNPPFASNKTSIVGVSNLIKVTPSAQRWSIGKRNGFLSSTSLETFHDHQTKSSSTYYTSSKHGQKLEVFRHALSKVGEDPLEGLNMIDAVQRLGIDYYFQEEIEAILHKQFMMFNPNEDCNYCLHEVALRFRLLRQEGYFASADIFDNLKDNEGIFQKKLISQDINGLMGLYEASQLSIEGEDLLDEAGNFSGQLLAASIAHLDHHQAKIVENTLRNPHHKSLAKFMAKNYFVGNNSPGSNKWINVLQELAKTEFNMVQSLHQKEIFQISKWWRDVGLSKEMKFARDQPLKWYIWSVACLTDPSLSQERVELTKSISFIYIIDDIFDVCGTLEELTLFTQAINKYRWDIDATEQLPDHMKICFKTLNDMTNEISQKIHQKHGWNPLHSLRKTWSSLCTAFLEEAKWFASGKLPKTEEYLRNGIVSSGVHVVLVHAFFLLGEGLCNQTVELVDDMPRIISYTASILRLWDDFGSAKDENQEGHDGSYIECYMKEHHGCTKEEARQQTMNMISEAWKCLNRECLSLMPFPLRFAKASLNLARLVPLMYSYDDNQCLPTLEEHMKSMFYESVAI